MQVCDSISIINVITNNQIGERISRRWVPTVKVAVSILSSFSQELHENEKPTGERIHKPPDHNYILQCKAFDMI